MAQPRIGHWTVDPDGEVTLLGNRCRDCGEQFFPQRAYCPRCRSTALDEARIGGPGRLLSYTVVHQAPAGFTTPMSVGYGVLSGEAVVLAPIDAPPDELRKGMPLRIVEGDTGIDGEGKPLTSYRFAPVDDVAAPVDDVAAPVDEESPRA